MKSCDICLKRCTAAWEIPKKHIMDGPGEFAVCKDCFNDWSTFKDKELKIKFKEAHT